MIAVPHKTPFFCFWAVEDVIVSPCDNWPPPPRSQLHRSLQCCSLLNYYQWVWRDTCSLFPLTISLMTVSPTLSHTCMCADARPIFHLTWIWRALCGKLTRSIMCRRQRGQSMLSRECSRLMGITLPTQAQIYIRSRMDALMSRAHRNTDASL